MKGRAVTENALMQTRSLFIRRWGEMGATWGISRTMAEIHALLFLTGSPHCTDDIMEQLQVSRGNASMNLRQLVNWGLIRRTHIRGDRKEYFISDLDAWQMFETITRERRRREVEPIIETIDRCRHGPGGGDGPTQHG
jgi:DNA-binding transcriptional regulator GbsR (MarR family)